MFGPIFLQVASDNSSISTFTTMPSQRHSPEDWTLDFPQSSCASFLFPLLSCVFPSFKKHKTSKPLKISVYCPRRPHCGAKSSSPAGTKCQFPGCQREANKLSKLSKSIPSLSNMFRKFQSTNHFKTQAPYPIGGLRGQLFSACLVAVLRTSSRFGPAGGCSGINPFWLF